MQVKGTASTNCLTPYRSKRFLLTLKLKIDARIPVSYVAHDEYVRALKKACRNILKQTSHLGYVTTSAYCM